MENEVPLGKLDFKSNMSIYWSGIGLLIISVILADLFLIRDYKNFSFELYFLLMFPSWIGALSINNFETDRVKKILRDYLKVNYPEKLIEYDAKPVELLNSDSEDILDLFADPFLIADPLIATLKTEAKRITQFMYAVFFTLPVLLFVSVFFILKR
jgi:hypothetical protein